MISLIVEPVSWLVALFSSLKVFKQIASDFMHQGHMAHKAYLSDSKYSHEA